MTNRQFGPNQRAWLKWIKQSGDEGVREWQIMGSLSGTAKRYGATYNRAFKSAMDRHNTDTCPDNCPLPKGSRIVPAPGPQGGKGWKLQIQESIYV